MKKILQAPVADREGMLRAMLEPTTGMYRYFPGEVDLVAFHRQSAGFPLDRDGQRCLDERHRAWDHLAEMRQGYDGLIRLVLDGLIILPKSWRGLRWPGPAPGSDSGNTRERRDRIPGRRAG